MKMVIIELNSFQREIKYMLIAIKRNQRKVVDIDLKNDKLTFKVR